jgi:hypothetical protein
MCGDDFLRCAELYMTGHQEPRQNNVMFVRITEFVTERMNITVLHVRCFVWRANCFTGRRILS